MIDICVSLAYLLVIAILGNTTTSLLDKRKKNTPQYKDKEYKKDRVLFIMFSIFWPVSLLIGGCVCLYEKICSKN